MEDYEIENARTWDDSLKDMPSADAADSPFEWQEVGNSKKKSNAQKSKAKAPVKPQHRVAARPPASTPSSNTFQPLQSRFEKSSAPAASTVSPSRSEDLNVPVQGQAQQQHVHTQPPSTQLQQSNNSQACASPQKPPAGGPASSRQTSRPRNAPPMPKPQSYQAPAHQSASGPAVASQRRPHSSQRVGGIPAKQWQPAYVRTHGHQKQFGSIHAPSKVLSDPDNDGQVAWRQRKPPTDTIQIPEDIGLQHRTDLGTIAADMGCFLYCDHRANRVGNLTFGIWGPPQDVQAIKKELTYRLGDEQARSHGSSLFAKVVSLTPRLRERYKRRWAKEVKRNRYRQYPPKDMAFEVIGTFLWPSVEYTPEDVLGKSYEAFDPIRMECECYVVYIVELSSFQVMGRRQNVQTALQRIRKTCFQLASRAVNPVRSYLLHWRNSHIPSHIYLESYGGPQILSPSNVARPLGISPRGDGRLDSEEAVKLAQITSSASVARIKAMWSNALRKMHYYQGHIEMRVRLGKFLLTQFIEPEDGIYRLQEYEDMTRASQFAGRVTEELGEPAAVADVLSAFQQASKLLCPKDALSDDLTTVKPVYSAVFVFDDAQGDIRLTMSWHEAEEHEKATSGFAQERSQWVRLDRDSGEVHKLLDMSLIDLSTSSAWGFQLTACRAIEEQKVPKELKTFPGQVQLDTKAALQKSPDKCFVTYNPFRQPKVIRQQVTYRYGISGMDYTFELTRFQDRVFPVRQSLIEQVTPTVYEPCWGLNVYRADWDTMLAGNEHLPIGVDVKWGDDISEWFPEAFGRDYAPGADGFAQLIHKLVEIEKLVQERCVVAQPGDAWPDKLVA